MTIVTVIQRQRIWEVHEYELTDSEYKAYRKMSKNERIGFLDSIGGTPAEYEIDDHFVHEVIK